MLGMEELRTSIRGPSSTVHGEGTRDKPAKLFAVYVVEKRQAARVPSRVGATCKGPVACACLGLGRPSSCEGQLSRLSEMQSKHRHPLVLAGFWVRASQAVSQPYLSSWANE